MTDDELEQFNAEVWAQREILKLISNAEASGVVAEHLAVIGLFLITWSVYQVRPGAGKSPQALTNGTMHMLQQLVGHAAKNTAASWAAVKDIEARLTKATH